MRKSNPTVIVHPMAELVAKYLFGIKRLPAAEMRKAASHCAIQAAKFFDREQQAAYGRGYADAEAKRELGSGPG